MHEFGAKQVAVTSNTINRKIPTETLSGNILGSHVTEKSDLSFYTQERNFGVLHL